MKLSRHVDVLGSGGTAPGITIYFNCEIKVYLSIHFPFCFCICLSVVITALMYLGFALIHQVIVILKGIQCFMTQSSSFFTTTANREIETLLNFDNSI